MDVGVRWSRNHLDRRDEASYVRIWDANFQLSSKLDNFIFHLTTRDARVVGFPDENNEIRHSTLASIQRYNVCLTRRVAWQIIRAEKMISVNIYTRICAENFRR